MATADFVYNSAREKFATKQLNWLTETVKAALVGAAYGPLPTHEFVSDIGSGIIIRSEELTNKEVRTGGICAGEIPEFEALLSVQVAVGVVLYVDTGDDTTSTLLYYSSGGVGFPFTPAGFTYAVLFDQANGGFFQV